MNPDLEVDTEALRRAASDVSATGARVTAAAAEEPPPPAVPRWATTDAALLAAEAARHQLTMIGADVDETARRIRAAAADYELADARAVTRLRLTR
ncbi:MAG TPA: type VII secretion target [Actinoplanes sp.]|nr:type VII secretion target [Actinoplanes sp.]